MDQAPLVIDEINAGQAFVKRLHDYVPVKAAWWLRRAEQWIRNLYVAVDVSNQSDVDLAYGEVLRITREIKDDYYIDPFRVKVVSTNDPVAKAIMDSYRRFPAGIRPRFDGRVIGGVAVDEVYIYPPLPAKP
jgi:hypothetical protein